ncbi:MAG: hypothetical protein EPO07_04460, partial [Verrucomicrobia bacterium]
SVATVNAAPGKTRVGKVVRIQGAARYSTGNNLWQPLKVGATLKAGTIVQTAQDSYVDIVLGEERNSQNNTSAGDYRSYKPVAEQDVVRVLADSVLSIDKLEVVETGADVVTETQLDLRMGKVFGTTKKLSAGSRYEVKMPNGVAGIRGTIYTVSSDGVVQVLVGSVVVAYTQPDGTVVTQVVTGGYQYDAKTGLVTPIPNFDQQAMVKAAKEARIGPNTPPTSFVVDQTTYYVSPRTGFNGNSGASVPGGP